MSNNIKWGISILYNKQGQQDENERRIYESLRQNEEQYFL